MDRKKVVLVFGGSGLLGAHCYYFLKDKYKVISTYNSINPRVPNSIKFDVLNNISNLDFILKTTKPDIIINTIALVSVDGCENNLSLAKKLNVDFVLDLVTSMRRNSLVDTHLIHISSDSVYGNCKDLKNHAWVETDSKNPLSIYAKTKLQSESEANKHRGPVSILRTAFYGINPNSRKGLLWWIISNAKKGNELDAWENIYFSPISAKELVKIIDYLCNKKITGIYNVGSLDGCNKFDFVYNVCKNIELKPKINRVSNKDLIQNIDKGIRKQSIRPANSILCSKKLYEILPWAINWNEDLNSYIGDMLPFPKD